MKFSTYSKEAPFSDPVVRCTNCKKLVVVEAQISIEGRCICGSRRFAEIRNLSEEEHDAVKHYWPEFAKVFAPKDEGSGIIIGMPGGLNSGRDPLK